MLLMIMMATKMVETLMKMVGDDDDDPSLRLFVFRRTLSLTVGLRNSRKWSSKL